MINNVIFNKQQGGLGRPLAGKDHYSGVLFYSSSATQSTFETIFQPSDLSSSDAELVEIVDDFFRYAPQGVLFVGEVEQDTSYDFEELIELQNYAKGQIRQALIYNMDSDVDATNISAIQAVATTLESAYRPLSIVYSGDYGTYNTFSDIPDMLADTQKNVSVVVSKDVNKTVDAGGALLGCIARAKVSESIGWVQKFNLQSGDHYVDIEMVTGEKLEDMNESMLTSLKDKGLIFIRDFVDVSGNYFVDDYTLDLVSSDYAKVRYNRTIDKAVRNCRVTLVPDLNRPLNLNTDGSLGEDMISYFSGKISNVLNDMVNAEELSGYRVTIDPLQPILSTGELEISIFLLPIAAAEYIKVNIGYTVTLS